MLRAPLPTFAPLFQQRSWRHGQVLLIGAILASGRRTVTSILRITGLRRERRFVNYHRILNRAAWSSRAAARVLLGLLLNAFVPAGPALQGRDDTIERRRGKCISAKEIYRRFPRVKRSLPQLKPAAKQMGSRTLLVPSLPMISGDWRHDHGHAPVVGLHIAVATKPP